MTRYAFAALPGIVVWGLVAVRPSRPWWLGHAIAWLGAVALIVACYVLGSRAPRRVRWPVALVDLSAVVAMIIVFRPVEQFSD